MGTEASRTSAEKQKPSVRTGDARKESDAQKRAREAQEANQKKEEEERARLRKVFEALFDDPPSKTTTPPPSASAPEKKDPVPNKSKEESLSVDLIRLGYTQEFIRTITRAGYSVNKSGVIESTKMSTLVGGISMPEKIVTKSGTITEFEPNFKDPIINVESTGDGWIKITRKHSPNPIFIRVESIPTIQPPSK